MRVADDPAYKEREDQRFHVHHTEQGRWRTKEQTARARRALRLHGEGMIGAAAIVILYTFC